MGKIIREFLFIGNNVDDGGGIEEVILFFRKRELCANNKEVLDLILIAVQVKTEVDTSRLISNAVIRSREKPSRINCRTLSPVPQP